MNAYARVSWLVPVLVALLVCPSGCVKSKVTVFVNPDGSGHLVVSRLFNRQTVETTEMQRQQMDVMEMPDMPGMADMKARMKADPFYDEKTLQREAKMYGAGVKLVKSRRLDIDGGRGSIAVYSFKDINDLFVSTDFSPIQNMLYGNFMPDMGMDDDDGGGRGRRGKSGLEFTFQTGEVSRLKILLPDFDASDSDFGDVEEVHEAMEEELKENAEEMDTMAEWFDPAMMAYSMPVGFDYRYMGHYAGDAMSQGMAVNLEIAVNGKVVACTASHTNAANRRVVLLDMDSSRRNKKGKASDRNYDLYNYHDINRLMRGVSKTPGSVVETNREVVVAFK